MISGLFLSILDQIVEALTYLALWPDTTRSSSPVYRPVLEYAVAIIVPPEPSHHFRLADFL